MRRALAASAAVLTLLAAREAWANGRFPYANQLVVDPSDPSHLVMRTTYGILQTFDGGASKWKWICERSVGYGGVFDPAIGATTSRIIAGTFDGLSVSPDKGCGWAWALGPLEKNYVIDVVVDPTNPQRALAITSTGLGDGFRVLIAESRDGAATWTQLGTQLPKDFNSETLEIAASRPERLYASGIFGEPRKGAIEKSDDGGQTWERIVIPLGEGRAPFLAAVDPKDPDRLYLRIAGTSNTSDAGKSPDRLLLSTDGAATWREIGNTVGDMLGFAQSPDGSKIAFGGPRDGISIASTTDYAFAKVSKVAARCLTWSAEGLYACGSDFDDGFTVGLSKDDGKTFAPLYELTELAQLVCPAGTKTAIECPRDWPSTQGRIGIFDAGPAPVDAGPPTNAPPPDDGGCAVRSPAVAAELFGVASLTAVIALLARRRRAPR